MTKGIRGALRVGERVVIRRPRPSDRGEFVRLMRASRSFHHPWVTAPASDEGFDAYLRRLRRRNQAGFLVCLADTGAIVGVVNVNEIVEGCFCSAYLGYYVGAPFAGRGLMTEGLGLVISHVFGAMGLHRLEANIQPGNSDSLALVARLGFRREGFSPRYLKLDGAWRDHERWALLVEDWRGRKV